MGSQIEKIMKQGFKPEYIHKQKDGTKVIELIKHSKYGNRSAFYDGKVLVVEKENDRIKFNRKYAHDKNIGYKK